MSLVEKAMQTIAQYMPDAKRDPLLDQDGYLGKDLERVDAEAKVKGAARFTAEFHPENLAHAALVYSTIAKGKVSRLDTTRAEGAPGVVRVITPRNMPKLKAPPLVDLGDLKKGMAASDLPILQDSAVHWDGQPIAIVVAETLEQAEQAAALVDAEYETAAASVSFEGAKPRAEAPADVMGEPAVLKVGDFVKAYEAADVRVNHIYRTPRYNHNAIEPHATIAFWEDNGELIVFESSQSVNTAARTLAYIFNLDWDKVRVLAPYVGGGFGGKGGLWNHTSLCAAASKVVKRPVKLALSREGVYRVVGGRTPAEQRIALGANRNGELTAVMHSAVTGTTSHGRYAEQCTFPVRHMWKAPNLFVEQKIVNLDTVTNTWMRAPGESIGTFALESALDELSYALRLDPIELRRRNEPDKDPTKGTPYSSRQLMEAYRRGADKFGWAARNPEPRSQRDGKWMVGQGVATAYYPYYRFPATVRMRLSADGKALVQAPAAEMGMGTATVQIQHAADRLGLPLANVTFEYGDSRLPDTPLMAGGSNQTATMVAAVRAAVEELQKEVMKLAQKSSDSPLAGAKHDAVEARSGGLYRSDSGAGESYVDILRRAGRDYVEVETTSGAPTEMMKWSMASYAAQFCEVRVHEDTGETRISRWLCALDCGRVLNPKTASSQLRGGIVMGIGMALTEETLFDERRGRIMNPSLSEYHVAVNLDVPDIEVLFLNIPDEQAPYGARGIGEIGITGVAAAVANAVYHATGKRIRELPITLDKLM